jgi:hypothetical protein
MLTHTSIFKRLRYLLIVMGIFVSSALFAQGNLVPNPSFEEKYSCPGGQFQLTPTCKYWYDPISIMDTMPGIFYTFNDWGTAMYFHRCNNTTVGVPVNVAGVQDARTGDAYAGISVFRNTHVPDFQTKSMNYISVELKEALIPGQRYHAEFYYSLAELYSNPDPDIFIKSLVFVELGMLFTDAPIKRYLDTTNNQPTNIYSPPPQIAQMMGPEIDTVNWIKVSGTFTAKGGEKHLTIGCFKDPDTIKNFQYTYIFIDDVAVYPIDSFIPYPEFDIMVWPVPSRDRMIWFVRGDGELLTGFIDIYDPKGRKVYSRPTFDMDIVCVLDLSSLRAGVYLYSIREHDGTTFKTGKIILL